MISDSGPTQLESFLRSRFIQHILLITVALCAFFCSPEAAWSQNHPDLPFLDKNTRYLWPTNASNYLSATFGETRAAHFHAAVDIGTWGQQGYRVYATRDGLLSRVSISPTGYGNAVYLKHDDGSFSLYAHLRDFIPKIRELVDSLRFRSYTFNFDENLESYGIRFNQGDLIAYSGDTGIGPPHLHFELRTPSNNPFNPLLVGIKVDDSVPPRFASLSIEPLELDATVNGQKDIVTVPISGSGRSFEFSPVRVQGKIGLGVDASDRADAMRNVYAVYELKMTINDSLFFHSRVDSFEIRNSRMMLLDRVYPLLRDQRKGYQRLYIADGNETTFYKDVGHSGVVDLPPGTWNVRIEASDFFGNTSIATGRLIVSAKESVRNPPQTLQTTGNTPLGTGEQPISDIIRNARWNSDWFTVSQNQNRRIQKKAEVGSFLSRAPKTATTDSDVSHDLRTGGIQRLDVEGQAILLHRVGPGNSSSIRTPDQRLRIDFRANTLFDSLSVAIAHYRIDGRPYFEIIPNNDPLRGSYVLRYLMDENDLKMRNPGIYSVIGSGRNVRYNFMGAGRRGGYLQAFQNTFGTFTVLSDTTAPSISRPRIYQRSDGKWFASVRVSDNLSGVDHTTAEFYINGVRGIAEFDPFGSLLIYHLPNFSPRPNNRMRVILRDRVGNRAEAEFDVRR